MAGIQGSEIQCWKWWYRQNELGIFGEKSKIVNLRGFSAKKYSKGFDFLVFTIQPLAYKWKVKTKSIPCIFVSQKSKTSIMEKFKTMNIHKRRKTLEEIAKEINPVLRGVINYYHKFWDDDMRIVWNQLNARLLKWVKWEKGLYKCAAVKYLQTKYKEFQLICPLVIGISINMNIFNVI